MGWDYIKISERFWISIFLICGQPESGSWNSLTLFQKVSLNMLLIIRSRIICWVVSLYTFKYVPQAPNQCLALGLLVVWSQTPYYLVGFPGISDWFLMNVLRLSYLHERRIIYWNHSGNQLPTNKVYTKVNITPKMSSKKFKLVLILISTLYVKHSSENVIVSNGWMRKR